MAEIRHEAQAYVIEMVHDECEKKGVLEYQPLANHGNIAENLEDYYPHRCNSCGVIQHFGIIYPHNEFKKLSIKS